MRIVFTIGLILALAPGTGADDKKAEKVDPKLVVGHWKQYEPKDTSQITSEFTADGKVHSWIDDRNGTKPEKLTGAYKIEGNVITITVNFEGKPISHKSTITKLTKDEFHTEFMGTLKMRRYEPRKDEKK